MSEVQTNWTQTVLHVLIDKTPSCDVLSLIASVVDPTYVQIMGEPKSQRQDELKIVENKSSLIQEHPISDKGMLYDLSVYGIEGSWSSGYVFEM